MLSTSNEGAGDDRAAVAEMMDALEEERMLPLRRRFHMLGGDCQNWFGVDYTQKKLIIKDRIRIVSRHIVVDEGSSVSDPHCD